jgi:hypothetical protein
MLEGRSLLSATTLTFSASPTFLTPISPRNEPHAILNRPVYPVTIAGLIINPKGTPTLTYQVFDQYGMYQPGGTVVPSSTKDGNFLFDTTFLTGMRKNPGTFGLSILRKPTGRQYLVVVTETDGNGTTQASATVTVPPVGFFAFENAVRRHQEQLD